MDPLPNADSHLLSRSPCLFHLSLSHSTLYWKVTGIPRWIDTLHHFLSAKLIHKSCLLNMNHGFSRARFNLPLFVFSFPETSTSLSQENLLVKNESFFLNINCILWCPSSFHYHILNLRSNCQKAYLFSLYLAFPGKLHFLMFVKVTERSYLNLV